MKKNVIYDSVVCMTSDSCSNNKRINRLKEACEEYGIENYEIYIDEVPNRITTHNRSSLEKLCEEIEHNEIGCVIINGLESISRDCSQAMSFLALVDNHNCDVISSDNMDLKIYQSVIKELDKVSKNKKQYKINKNKKMEELER